MGKYFESIIAISDIQAPFGHRDFIEFLVAVKKEYFINKNKTKIINQGDEADFHNFGKWTTDPNGLGPMQEYTAMLEQLQMLWSLFPEQDICISNHTIRPLKAAFQAGIPRVFLREYHEFLKAPKGCRWADSWIYNNVKFEHGEAVSGINAAMRAAKMNRMSTSIGHQHTHGGVQYSTTEKDTIFGLNTGCLIDLDTYAFAYSKTFREKPTLGCGVILDCVAHFIPMVLDKRNRWVGKL